MALFALHFADTLTASVFAVSAAYPVALVLGIRAADELLSLKKAAI